MDRDRNETLGLSLVCFVLAAWLLGVALGCYP